MKVAEMFRLDGRVVLCAGAGRGIGATTALALAQAGADIAILSRTASQLDEVAAKARESGGRVVAIPTDAGDPGAVESAIATTMAELGRLDVLVSTLGGSMPKAFVQTSDRSLGVGFEKNVIDNLRLVRLAVPHLVASDAASIVLVSSAVGHVAGRGYVGYGTVKAALDHAVRMLSVELNPKIRINAVAPGAVVTQALEMVLADPEIKHALEANTPLRRLGTPDDIAAAILYLASPASSYVTGQILAVDGGLQVANLPMPLDDF